MMLRLAPLAAGPFAISRDAAREAVAMFRPLESHIAASCANETPARGGANGTYGLHTSLSRPPELAE
jgi:hypothetical protein